MQKINKIVIHHSASEFGNAALITKWHLDRGFFTIGYHFVILNGQISHSLFNSDFDGHIETGRPLDFDEFMTSVEVGAHAIGVNHTSIGICLIGNTDFSTRQMHSLVNLLERILRSITSVKSIIGHRDLPGVSKNCPGFDVAKFLESYQIRLPKY